MNLRTRAFLPAAALAASITLLCGGCSAASQGTAAAPAATATGAAGPGTASAAASAPGAAQATAPASSAVPASASAAAAPPVYLAEGGSVPGVYVHAPRCRPDCGLSGDSTASLTNMSWSTWTSTEAVGTGTEQLDDCNPNCAAGALHAIPVRVTLSKPVMVCVAGTGRWFWTRVTFRWPGGLPAVFSGDSAPANPLEYTGLASQAAKTCH